VVRRQAIRGLAAAVVATLGALLLSSAQAAAATPVFVNEIHYDNTGTDAGEAIEVAAAQGTDLTGWSIALYNDAGVGYDTDPLPGGPVGASRVVTVSYPENGIQNGPADGLALVNGSGQAVQLLSYEGTFTATNGPAAGMTSVDIGLAEAGSEPAGQSLQLIGTGSQDTDFFWTGPRTATFGALNVDQAFDGASGGGNPPPALGACGEASTPIHDVQGNGAATPVAGQVVVVDGVVVGDYQGATGSGDLGGFYLQEPDADVDADPQTSEGIFVSDADATPEVSVGDLVRLRGTAGEGFGQTQIGGVNGAIVCSNGATLPGAAQVDLPAATGTALEPFEGMRVSFADQLVVTESRLLDDFGELRLSAGGVLQTPTDVVEPGMPAQDLDAANDLRTIVLDDGANAEDLDPPPFISSTATLRRGDSISSLAGVLGFGFSAYRVQPTGPVSFVEENARPDAPEIDGDLKVGAFNVLNYFTTLGERGAQTAEEFDDQEAKIVAAINGLGADVLSLQEIESNGGLALDTLVAALNEDAGAGTWAGVPVPANFSGTDQITVAIIYKPEAVTPVGDPSAFPDPAFALARQPIAQTFEANDGDVFTVIANHFKSKNCGGATGPDTDQGDGQSCFNASRISQANALLGFIEQLQDSSGDDDVLALGDFNAYSREDPIDAFEAGGLTDLGEALITEADRYSFVFDGAQGSLDHAMATESLADKAVDAGVWHINSDEPDAFLYFGAPSVLSLDPYAASDHDPELIGLDTEAPAAPRSCGKRTATMAGTRGRDELTGTGAKDVVAALGGRDEIRTRGGDDLICPDGGRDDASAGPGDDRVLASGEGRDDITCGPGKDVAVVDRRDETRGCERVRR
jgi:uncharacterized protein